MAAPFEREEGYFILASSCITVVQPIHSNTMYTVSQKHKLWPTEVYKKCPLFLDYPYEKFSLSEERVYILAAVMMKARNSIKY